MNAGDKFLFDVLFQIFCCCLHPGQRTSLRLCSQLKNRMSSHQMQSMSGDWHPVPLRRYFTNLCVSLTSARHSTELFSLLCIKWGKVSLVMFHFSLFLLQLIQKHNITGNKMLVFCNPDNPSKNHSKKEQRERVRWTLFARSHSSFGRREIGLDTLKSDFFAICIFLALSFFDMCVMLVGHKEKSFCF